MTTSYFLTPQGNLLLLEVSALFLVNEHQVQEVSALESVVYVRVCWCEVCAGKIEANGNALSFDRCSIHYLEFIQVFCLSHRLLPRPNDLFPYYTQLHMLYFYSYQVEVDLAKNTIFQVELWLIEFELYMQAFLDADLHFNWSICVRLFSFIRHDELFLFRYTVIVPVYYDIDIIPESDHYTVVCLKLLFNSIELEVIGDILCKRSWWFQISDNL